MGYFAYYNTNVRNEYIATLLLVIVTIIIPLVVHTFDRYIPNLTNFKTTNLDTLRSSNVDISHPYNADSVPYYAVLIITIIPVPSWAMFISLTCQNMLEFHAAFMTLLQGGAFCLLVTETTKRLAGRLRPDYLYRCTSIDATGHCQGGSNLADGHYSFPSGHTSTAFFGMVFLSLYIAGKTRLFHPRIRPRLWKLFACSVCWMAAFGIGVSRTTDYRHNFSDVIAGALIGTLCAYAAYFMHFPALNTVDCNKALETFEDDDVAKYSVDNGSSHV